MPKFTDDWMREAGFPYRGAPQKKAIGLVVEHYNKLLPDPILKPEDWDDKRITKHDVALVWFSKTLQNWKALVITVLPDDQLYFEVTYNGDKKETYIDVYDKIHNFSVPDVN